MCSARQREEAEIKFGPPAVDYRRFRVAKLNSPEFRHLKLLIFWPLFGLAFLTVERFWIRDSYFPVSCALDEHIPFCEYFLIPYLFWFVFLVRIHVYALFYDIESFKKLMKFIIISYNIALFIYIIFPNCQDLRPLAFERDNAFTRFLAGFISSIQTPMYVHPCTLLVRSRCWPARGTAGISQRPDGGRLSRPPPRSSPSPPYF